MTFSKESDFENALVNLLTRKGWDSQILLHPSEEDLINNWANILFENNRQQDRLNGQPLTKTEMQQILDQVAELKSPVKLNSFINGKTIAIKRDNPADSAHLGKEVTLKIYDRQEIAAGQSRYQIARQPIFKRFNALANDRRGDVMLLINGMPVIHIELKSSDVPVSQAENQIEKYAKEGIFTGIFSLIQIFVAMKPEETVYFANPGADGSFDRDFHFHWADFNNEPMNDWKEVTDRLLSIPMAHQMIGFYTVADESDGILKVMRSYQFYAASRISDRVAKMPWNSKNPLGGFIWHTTGSGKTMTSFKSAQLIANSNNADKVVFLMDRIELGTQSLKAYRAFADDRTTVQDTEDTVTLISKLKSNAPADTLIVTSIQKLSNIGTEDSALLKTADLNKINAKRLVFIVDECHRSTFGEMLSQIKSTFPRAIFFGFTGTPIQEENQKKMTTTSMIFGNELHRYSIADGIRDKNVLGFDPYKVLTFKDSTLRETIALEKARATSISEALNDPKKKDIYLHYMNKAEVPMAAKEGNNAIENFIPMVQYETEKHQRAVATDIIQNWDRLSHDSKFHAILATSSIPEAIDYYRLFKRLKPNLKVTALFEPSIDNTDSNKKTNWDKEAGVIEILEDYNANFNKKYDMGRYAAFKRDVSARLAHKESYLRSDVSEQINLLIVVNQMLTGFDSKWINTLYLDKVIVYENIIQAFSRTNRLFGPDKPFGTIRYYRKPHTMEVNIEKAVQLYSGDKAFGLFVDRLDYNLKKLNELYDEIVFLFKNAGIENFEKNPSEEVVCKKFASTFRKFNGYLQSAKIQGFTWEKDNYQLTNDTEYYLEEEKISIQMHFNKTTYLTLVQRYKELSKVPSGGDNPPPYDIESYITEIDTGLIDENYMNSRFTKYLKSLTQEGISPEQLQNALDELHKSFATLSQEEQKFANIFLHDIQDKSVIVDPNKTIHQYIIEYMEKANNDQIHQLSFALGLDENKLRSMMNIGITEKNINEYGKFDELKQTVDTQKAKEYLKIEGRIPEFKIKQRIDKLLRKFILTGEL